MECDNRFYLYTGHKFLCTISSTSVTIKKSPLSNFRIVSEQGRTKDLKTQNWQLYKSPERASAVSTNIWGDQPSRRSGSGFIMFGSEAWVPATSLCVWKSISCLLSLIPKICLSFSCSSLVQHQESLGLFGLIVHGTAHLPVYNGCGVAFQTKKKIRRMRQNKEFGLKFGKKFNPSLKHVLVLAPQQKDQIHCPYCYQKVKRWGSLESHIQ